MAKYRVLEPLLRDGIKYQPNDIIELPEGLATNTLLSLKTIAPYHESSASEEPTKTRTKVKS